MLLNFSAKFNVWFWKGLKIPKITASNIEKEVFGAILEKRGKFGLLEIGA